MKQELTLRIILETPLVDVDFALQKGSGTGYHTIQKQRSTARDLSFECTVTVKNRLDGQPDFAGVVVQGTPSNRFIYIDIGASAGQLDTVWRRRLKVPLRGITTEMIDESVSNPSSILETKVPGTGRDGGPACGTVKPFMGWYVATK
ncbi:DUF5990 family protein [Spirosoma linguale]|uniref:Uncharacterized protein n=1 Tax=Spirosoma linguale (strain ATCC 33905 / DSM 74 / LMG 10896 / Claus 1) TaxID=504472 RepID=D2QMN4_SPILD|nr:hypothetical protein Slin_4467 [Spirosoma linguale DSM 74]